MKERRKKNQLQIRQFETPMEKYQRENYSSVEIKNFPFY